MAVVISGGRAGRSGPIARGGAGRASGRRSAAPSALCLRLSGSDPGGPARSPAPVAAGPDRIDWDRVGSGVARPSGSTAVRLRSHVGRCSALSRSTPHGVSVSVTPGVGPVGARPARRLGDGSQEDRRSGMGRMQVPASLGLSSIRHLGFVILNRSLRRPRNSRRVGLKIQIQNSRLPIHRCNGLTFILSLEFEIWNRSCRGLSARGPLPHHADGLRRTARIRGARDRVG